MRVDAFMYAGEDDILECRLTELNEVIDMFVISEGDYTHGGAEPKGYVFDEARFAPWLDKITHVKVPLNPEVGAWARENRQRQALSVVLNDCDKSDLILLSDIDEIPTRLAVAQADTLHASVAFRQRGHYLTLNWLHPEPWIGTISSRGPVKNLNMHRSSKNWTPYLQGAGWHLSWLGGPHAVKDKLRHWCHAELPTHQWDIQHGIHVDGQLMSHMDIDHTYPQWIVDGYAPEAWYAQRTAQQVS